MDATRLLPSATAYATPWVAGIALWWGGSDLAARAALASLVMAAVVFSILATMMSLFFSQEVS